MNRYKLVVIVFLVGLLSTLSVFAEPQNLSLGDYLDQVKKNSPAVAASNLQSTRYQHRGDCDFKCFERLDTRLCFDERFLGSFRIFRNVSSGVYGATNVRDLWCPRYNLA